MPRQLLLQWWKYAHVHKKVRGIIQMRPHSPHFSTKISCARARFAIKVLYHPLLPRAAECHILRMSKIGRASCRGRGEVSVGAGSLKKKNRNKRWNCDWSSDVCSSDLRSFCDKSFVSSPITPRRRVPYPTNV